MTTTLSNDYCDYLLKRGTATYWQTSVGSAIDTIIEPVQLQRDRRIEAKKKLLNLEKRDKKQLKKGKK